MQLCFLKAKNVLNFPCGIDDALSDCTRTAKKNFFWSDHALVTDGNILVAAVPAVHVMLLQHQLMQAIIKSPRSSFKQNRFDDTRAVRILKSMCYLSLTSASEFKNSAA